MNRAYVLQELAKRIQQTYQADPLFLDTETTDKENGEVIEVAVVDLAGRVLLNTLVRPLGPIAVGAQNIHHITPEMLVGRPAWDHFHPQVQTLLFGRTVVAYNAPFDEKAVARSCALHHLPAPMTAGWPDAMRLYAAWHGEWNSAKNSYRWQSLEAAVVQCGLSGVATNSHRALDDIQACRQVFLYLYEQIAAGVLGAEMRPVDSELAPLTTGA